LIEDDDDDGGGGTDFDDDDDDDDDVFSGQRHAELDDDDDDEDNGGRAVPTTTTTSAFVFVAVPKDANGSVALGPGLWPPSHSLLAASCCAFDINLKTDGIWLGGRRETRSCRNLCSTLHTEMSVSHWKPTSMSPGSLGSTEANSQVVEPAPLR